MQYRIDEEAVIIRLDPGDEVMESLLSVCEKEGYRSAEVYGVGVTMHMKLNNAREFNDGTKYQGNSIYFPEITICNTLELKAAI